MVVYIQSNKMQKVNNFCIFASQGNILNLRSVQPEDKFYSLELGSCPDIILLIICNRHNVILYMVQKLALAAELSQSNKICKYINYVDFPHAVLPSPSLDPFLSNSHKNSLRQIWKAYSISIMHYFILMPFLGGTVSPGSLQLWMERCSSRRHRVPNFDATLGLTLSTHHTFKPGWSPVR